MKRIFLISGFGQAGKDTTADFLKRKLIGRTLILHNADVLKYYAMQYGGWNGEKDETGRTVLQLLGTEQTKIKLNKPLFWTEKVCDCIEIFKDAFEYFCVPDTRFRSEIYYPLARFPYNVTTVRIHRLNFDNGLTDEQKNHISEQELIEFKHDYDIYSESGLDNLEIKIDEYIKWLSKNKLV